MFTLAMPSLCVLPLRLIKVAQTVLSVIIKNTGRNECVLFFHSRDICCTKKRCDLLLVVFGIYFFVICGMELCIGGEGIVVCGVIVCNDEERINYTSYYVVFEDLGWLNKRVLFFNSVL